MGIRHLILVTSETGETLVAQYGQWDGDFNGVGKKILKWLDRTTIDTFKSQLKLTKLVKYGSDEYNDLIDLYVDIEGETLFDTFPQFDIESTSYNILDCIMENRDDSMTLLDCLNIRFTFLHHINLSYDTYKISVNTKFGSYENTNEEDLITIFETTLVNPMSLDNISIPIGSDNIKGD